MDAILWPLIEQRRVLLAVSGGIAAYKAAELCRLLRRAGAQVQVMMTPAARQFVGEATFAALSDRPVATELFDPQQEAQIGHIGLADWAELLLVAPATADFLAKLTCGLADDLPSTVCLACTAPLLLAPAMNVHMWEHPATQANLKLLVERGARLVGPDSGEMACGHTGAGRMAEPEAILQAAGCCLSAAELAGRRVLVTAGPTHEPIDPVRYLGNRSSGKMGVALAAEAACRGAEVTLIAGPMALSTPFGVRRIDVQTAAQLAAAVASEAGGHDVVIMAAAVADYRPQAAAPRKLKKEQAGQRLTLTLEQTADILAGLGARSVRPLLVGFAAETEADLDALAPAKLEAKGCDLLVANDVSAADAGFEVETNRVIVYEKSGRAEALPLLPKRQVAGQILTRVAQLLAKEEV